MWYRIKAEYIIVLSLVLVNVLTYHNLVSHDFVNLDDSVYVTGNAFVKQGLTAESIRWAFTTFHAEFWHPITWLSYLIDTELYGVNPAGYLFSNLLIHIVNTVALFFAFRTLTHEVWASALLAALFAVHPLHVECVAWISDRKDLLGGLFWILSIWQYYYWVNKPGLTQRFFLLLFFSLGLMSKPVLLTLPFILILIDIWPIKRIPIESFPSKNCFLSFYQSFKDKILLIALAIAFSLLAYLAQQKGGGIGSLDSYPIGDRVSNVVVSYTIYLFKTMWPTNLTVFYPFTNDLPFLKVAASFLMLLLISIASLRLGKYFSFFPVGWFWFLVSLIPAIGIIKIGDFAMADRYMYIPQIGLFIVFAWGLTHVRQRWLSAKVITILCCIIVFAFAFASNRQARHWQNSESLFLHALQVNQNNYFAHFSLGHVLAGKGDFNAAVSHFSKAVNLAPHKPYMLIDYGHVLVINSRFEEASTVLEKMLALDSPYRFAELHFLTGLSLTGQGRLKEAVHHLAIALDSKGESKIRDRYVISDSYQQPNLSTMTEIKNNRHNSKTLGQKTKRYVSNNEYDKALMLLGVKNDRPFLVNLAKKGYKNWLKKLNNKSISEFK